MGSDVCVGSGVESGVCVGVGIDVATGVSDGNGVSSAWLSARPAENCKLIKDT